MPTPALTAERGRAPAGADAPRGDSGGGEKADSTMIFTRLALAKKRSEEHTSELQSLMRISYAVFCLKKKKIISTQQHKTIYITEHTHTENRSNTLRNSNT